MFEYLDIHKHICKLIQKVWHNSPQFTCLSVCKIWHIYFELILSKRQSDVKIIFCCRHFDQYPLCPFVVISGIDIVSPNHKAIIIYHILLESIVFRNYSWITRRERCPTLDISGSTCVRKRIHRFYIQFVLKALIG